MRPTHDDDATYYHDGLSRTELSLRLTRAQVEADGAHTEAAVLRSALRRIATAVGLDGETVPAHVADAVEHYVRLTSGDPRLPTR
jgi:hypothetical protein